MSLKYKLYDKSTDRNLYAKKPRQKTRLDQCSRFDTMTSRQTHDDSIYRTEANNELEMGGKA